MVHNMNFEQLQNAVKLARENEEIIELKIKQLNSEDKRDFDNRVRIYRNYCETKVNYYELIKELNQKVDKENGYERYFNSIFLIVLVGIFAIDYVKPYFGLTVTGSYFNAILIGLLVAVFINVKIATSVSELQNRCFHYNKTIQENDRELKFLGIWQDIDRQKIISDFYKEADLTKLTAENHEALKLEKDLKELEFFLEIKKSCYDSLKIKEKYYGN
jgi:hypothetical protein